MQTRHCTRLPSLFTLVGVSLLAVAQTTNAALHARDLDGNPETIEAVYDDVLDVTWLANANLAETETFGVSGYDSDGSMSWDQAQQWLAGMNEANYLGFDDWRMPGLIDIGDDGCNESNSGTDCGWNVLTYDPLTDTTYSEIGFLFYENFQAQGSRQPDGTLTPVDQRGITNAADPNGYLNMFTGIVDWIYWFGVEYGPNPNEAWRFGMQYGHQEQIDKGFYLSVWAVRDGDVSEVPVPAAAWLFGSALITLGALRRKR